MEKTYQIKSNFCGTLISDISYSKEEAEQLVELYNREAVEIDLLKVGYSVVEAFKSNEE